MTTVNSTGKACNSIEANGYYQEYTDCQFVRQRGADFHISVWGPYWISVGGDVGRVRALRLTSTNLDNGTTERYWYAKPWGMVRYDRYENGQLVRQERFNTIWPGEPNLVLECGIGY